ncbi:hypothetical protein Sjap_017539 [Stephania japonica]|uniref:SSD domain-containing protein n=1 Tax=Stephania japonica TaxID=461633 RepID=A0AAP0NK22_9MAGN
MDAKRGEECTHGIESMGFYSNFIEFGPKVSYILMFAYISLTLGDVSLSSSFCISSKVGVDNMCILVHAVKRQPSDMPLEGRISNALVEVGPSITLASLSEIMAFTVGSFIPMPACRVFSMFAALAVFLDFLLQVTAFVALIIFDFLRTKDDRVDCFPCIKAPSSNSENDRGDGNHYFSGDVFSENVEVKISGLNQGKLGLLARYMKEIHAPILGLWGVKIDVVIVFVAFAFASIALCTRIEPGLEQRIVLPRDSYLQIARASTVPESSYIAKPAASWLDDFLVWMSPEAFGCCRKFTNGSYCPPDDQCFLHSDWHNNRPSTEQFIEKLPWFLNALPSADCSKGGHGAYTSSLDLNDYENGVIRASEFRTYHTPLNKQIDFVNAMRAAREFSSRISDSLKIDIFPYAMFYIFFEQYMDIWKTTLVNVVIALGAVFTVSLIITCSLWSSAIILLVLAMVVVDLMVVLSICGPPSTSLLVENRNAPNEKQEHQVLNSATHSS